MRIVHGRRWLWLLASTIFLLPELVPVSAFAMIRHALHPIHASITTIELNTKAHTLEIACKIFADDLEECVKKATGTQLYLGSPKELPNASALIEGYLRRHVRFAGDAQKLFASWKFVGRETEGDAVWCYLEIPNVHAVKRLTISNTVLTDLHDDQTNLVNVTVGTVRRSAVFRKGKDSETLEF
jgi:hypothetical protein